jgi:Aerotolerance regulator N-terminal
MTPLAPLYLLGALAIAGPILFHLWRRTPRGRREFSTLMFLSPSPPRVTSRSRVEHWLLLLLRASVLCLLALAFARPLWRTAISEPETASDEELVAVLVDTSASLRRDGAWPDLMKQLREQISKLPVSATVGLYRFDDRWSPLSDFAELKRLEPAARRDVVIAKLDDLKPGWAGTNLGEALVRTAGVLQEAQTERAVPAKLRILLASDLPTGANLAALHGFEWPGDLRVELLVARATSPSNAGLQLVERNLDLGDDVLRVRVSNAADSRKEQFTLTWGGANSESLSIYVPPGQSRVVVPPKRAAGDGGASLVLSGDDNDFDNTIHVAPNREETKLVVYCGGDKADDPDGLRFYLEGVFAASHRYRIELSSWREKTTAKAEEEPLSPQSRGEAPTTTAERPVLVVLAKPEADAGDFVTTHLANGGTVLIVARSAESGNESLKQCGLEAVTLSEAAVKRDAMLGDIDFEHPLFAPFAESQFSDFTGIRFWKHRSASVPESLRAGVLARFDDGDPALIEIPANKGRVWLMTAGWQPADSQLARSSKFPPLMFRMLEHASGSVPRAESVTAGSDIAWPAVQNHASSRGTVRRPDGSVTDDLAIDTPFAATEQPGLYSLTVDGRTETVAVNLAADESRTAPLPIEQLEALGVRLGTVETVEDLRRAKDRQRQLQLEELEQTQKLWRWGIIAVIVLLLIETWLAGRRATAATPETTE